jgi:hypothetical protein
LRCAWNTSMSSMCVWNTYIQSIDKENHNSISDSLRKGKRANGEAWRNILNSFCQLATMTEPTWQK